MKTAKNQSCIFFYVLVLLQVYMQEVKNLLFKLY